MEGILDPRRRRFIAPTRIVWISEAGVAGSQNLLSDDLTACTLSPGGDAPAAILLDFGRELHGGVRLDVPNSPAARSVRVRVRFGESVSEAMGETTPDHATHDWEIKAAWFGRTDVGDTGFRFVRIDLLDTDAPLILRQVTAIALEYDLEYQGAFECSDERINEIWRVGARTVHLCMQDHLWDGIKRDRLVWIGDMHPETMVVSAIHGAHPIVPASLDKVRDETPLPEWMNGISSYSLWWIIIQRDWYRYHGDLAYLQQQRAYLLDLLALVESKVDAEGREHLDGGRFLEWPTSVDPTATDAGLQAMTALALRAGAELCVIVGESEAAARANAVAARVEACPTIPTVSKQANALLVLAGLADAEATNAAILARDPDRNLSTFYGYYILQARAQAGDVAGGLDLLRSYWGAMLDLGATAFWEDFHIEWAENATRIDELPQPGKHDIHAEYGDFCYKGLRHSLCHGWAAGPTAWLMEHVLGVTPAAPGFAQVSIKPNLGNLQYARGSVPTPHGLIHVSHTLGIDGGVETVLGLPEGVALAS
ncbi:hypothetical protein CCAX7_66060 [Capsulimonas corticalis]|uniref:Uncharacterized protein n=1 Tax=Capsulimonas corticalis TaxID=2219043 RepID=A0A402CR98_9BACT|nr:alpha-L-rhamnosidase C-terminal domain-containing protein [Capsulimonas corticalis]BDI34555.1 hypothetical protein CCAX7_66060 [Capsulimonas corticalis]